MNTILVFVILIQYLLAKQTPQQHNGLNNYDAIIPENIKFIQHYTIYNDIRHEFVKQQETWSIQKENTKRLEQFSADILNRFSKESETIISNAQHAIQPENQHISNHISLLLQVKSISVEQELTQLAIDFIQRTRYSIPHEAERHKDVTFDMMDTYLKKKIGYLGRELDNTEISYQNAVATRSSNVERNQANTPSLEVEMINDNKVEQAELHDQLLRKQTPILETAKLLLAKNEKQAILTLEQERDNIQQLVQRSLLKMENIASLQLTLREGRSNVAKLKQKYLQNERRMAEKMNVNVEQFDTKMKYLLGEFETRLNHWKKELVNNWSLVNHNTKSNMRQHNVEQEPEPANTSVEKVELSKSNNAVHPDVTKQSKTTPTSTQSNNLSNENAHLKSHMIENPLPAGTIKSKKMEHTVEMDNSKFSWLPCKFKSSFTWKLHLVNNTLLVKQLVVAENQLNQLYWDRFYQFIQNPSTIFTPEGIIEYLNATVEMKTYNEKVVKVFHGKIVNELEHIAFEAVNANAIIMQNILLSPLRFMNVLLHSPGTLESLVFSIIGYMTLQFLPKVLVRNIYRLLVIGFAIFVACEIHHDGKLLSLQPVAFVSIAIIIATMLYWLRRTISQTIQPAHQKTKSTNNITPNLKRQPLHQPTMVA